LREFFIVLGRTNRRPSALDNNAIGFTSQAPWMASEKQQSPLSTDPPPTMVAIITINKCYPRTTNAFPLLKEKKQHEGPNKKNK